VSQHDVMISSQCFKKA